MKTTSGEIMMNNINVNEKEQVAEIHNKILENAGQKFKAEIIDNVIDSVIKDSSNIEIYPINTYILVKPYEVNPYQKLEVTEGGIALNTLNKKIMNTDRGEEEEAESWARVGTVIEASPNAKFVKEGDDVMYRLAQSVPVPFLNLGLEVVAESSILVVINEKLKERYGNL